MKSSMTLSQAFTFICKGSVPVPRQAKMKSLVEIDHEADFASDDRTNGVERGNVVCEAAEMQLQAPEAGSIA